MAGMRTRRAAPYGWTPLGLLILVALVDQLESNITAGVLPLVQADLGFSDAAAGALPAVSAVAAILVALPAGYAADRVGRVRLIAVVVGVWSVLTLGSALAVGFAMLCATRAVLGLATSVEDPATASLLADYYPPHSRAQAYGYHRMAFFVGGSLGLVIGGVVGEAIGWRGAYLLAALPGLLVATACWRLVEPRRGQLDRAAGAPEQVPPHAGLRPFLGQLRELLRNPSIRHVYLGLTVLFLGAEGFGFWQVSYYVRTFDLGTSTAAALTPVVDLVGVVAGTILGARLGDRWTGSVPGARILVGGGGLLAGSILLGAGLLVPALVPQLLVFTVATALMATAIPNLNAAVADLQPATGRGAGFGVLTILATLGAAAGPPLVGTTSGITGSLAIGFGAMAGVMVAGSLVLLTARAGYDRDVERARTASAAP
ncbi:MAG: MFS transporter [Pseudonocardia sp.]|nr:MFS transporter [Pseudonocardia sp.]